MLRAYCGTLVKVQYTDYISHEIDLWEKFVIKRKSLTALIETLELMLKYFNLDNYNFTFCQGNSQGIVIYGSLIQYDEQIHGDRRTTWA